LIAFVVRPGDEEISIVELGALDRIVKLVQKWRQRYVDHTAAREDKAEPGAELRRTIWEPVEQFLGKPDVVLVSPDGPLNFLPLAALPRSDQGKFLIQQYAFVTIPVPILLPEILAHDPRRPPDPSALLVGGVDYGTPPEVDRKPNSRIHVLPVFGELYGTLR